MPFNNKAQLHCVSLQVLNTSRLNQKSPQQMTQQHIRNTSQTVCVDEDTSAFGNPAEDTNEDAKRR